MAKKKVTTKEAKVKEPVVEVKEIKFTGDIRSKINSLIDLGFVNKFKTEDKTVVETAQLASVAAGKELGFSDASNLKIARKIALQVLRK